MPAPRGRRRAHPETAVTAKMSFGPTGVRVVCWVEVIARRLVAWERACTALADAFQTIGGAVRAIDFC